MNYSKTTFDNEPSMIEYEGGTIRINFDVEQIEVSVDNTDNKDKQQGARPAFAAYVVRIPQPLDRDKVVDAVVSAAYPSDRMQAIINNHFLNLATIADGGELDNDELAHEEEYTAMQEWRKKAKTVAANVMTEYLANI